MDLFPMSVRSQARMEIDPRKATAERGVSSQHVPKYAVAPRRRAAAEEQTIGPIALTSADSGLQGCLAALSEIRADLRFVFGRGRPGRGHHEIVHLEIGLVDGQRPGKIAEVAVQINVVFVGAHAVRKT